MQLTSQEYFAEVENLAVSIVAEAADQCDCNTVDTFDADSIRDTIFDTVLHETIDGHQWIIYYAYNLSIIEHSSNDDYMINELGIDSAGESLKSGGLSGLHQAIAYWALYADVAELIDDKIQELQDSFDQE